MRRIALATALLGLGCATPPQPAHLGAADSPKDAGDLSERAHADSPWQARCAQWLEGALDLATQKEPELRGAWVERESLESADGVSREALVVAVFPPVFRLGGLHIRVEREQPAPAAQAADGIWQRHAEIYGGYHAMHLKRAGSVRAGIAFDGWRSEQVEELAPIFEVAVDHCFGD